MKNLRLKEQHVLSDDILEKIARELPDFYPGINNEFLKEIKYFKETKQLNDYNFSVDFNLIGDDVFEDLNFKRKIKGENESLKTQKK